jgi:hypothetical protein
MADGWNRKLQCIVSLYLLVPVARATIDYTNLLQLDGMPERRT